MIVKCDVNYVLKMIKKIDVYVIKNKMTSVADTYPFILMISPSSLPLSFISLIASLLHMHSPNTFT